MVGIAVSAEVGGAGAAQQVAVVDTSSAIIAVVPAATWVGGAEGVYKYQSDSVVVMSCC